MDEDRPLPEERTKEQERAEALYTLVSGPLAAAQTRLAAHSRAIPSLTDFHFYNNFDNFKTPASGVYKKAVDLLERCVCELLPENPTPLPDDPEDACDLVVTCNDELLERFGAAMDEFKSCREELEGKAVAEGKAARAAMEDGGFQIVHGKKKKKGSLVDSTTDSVTPDAKTVAGDRKVTPARFHIPSIRRPQEEYNILVNNTHKPFEHVWLERREDESVVHPLEKLSIDDFVHRNNIDEEPVEPPPMESTPFKFVEDVAELKKLASKLHGVSEFAVDLEHNQYRSFLGLTCLMQISTRTEDFVVDTLKLRVHIGPHLREIFRDPAKRKVMHGADKDILWLQRDFGIYVCNMFDTGQASRVLQLERNSLEYLLRHYCGVMANKEYQNADWRLRPLPEEMIKYAREDTHYLLYLYDIMSRELQTNSDLENDDKLFEVYKRSSEVCIQLYQKDLLTETSYMHIYGLREADFNSQQLAAVAGLCKWRDDIARSEDESTGYILPNRLLIDIAGHLPSTNNQLRRLFKTKHPFVERHLGSIVTVVQKSIGNAADFECAAEQLRKERLEAMLELNKGSVCEDSGIAQLTEDSTAGENVVSESMGDTVQPLPRAACGVLTERGHSDDCDASVAHYSMVDSHPSMKSQLCSSTVSLNASATNNASILLNSTKVTVPSVPVLQKPTGMGALLGGGNRQANSSAVVCSTDLVSYPSVSIQKKLTGAFSTLFGSSTKKSSAAGVLGSTDLKNESKLEQIKSSVSLPFHTFSGVEMLEADVPQCSSPSQPSESLVTETGPTDKIFQVEEMIPLESDTDNSQLSPGTTDTVDTDQMESEGQHARGTDTSSLAEPSSGSENCFRPLRQADRNSDKKFQIASNHIQFQPFDYAAARKTVDFSGVQRDDNGSDGEGERRVASRGSRGKKKGSSSTPGESQRAEYQAPRRRQAFPPTGNKSGTFL